MARERRRSRYDGHVWTHEHDASDVIATDRDVVVR